MWLKAALVVAFSLLTASHAVSCYEGVTVAPDLSGQSVVPITHTGLAACFSVDAVGLSAVGNITVKVKYYGGFADNSTTCTSFLSGFGAILSANKLVAVTTACCNTDLCNAPGQAVPYLPTSPPMLAPPPPTTPAVAYTNGTISCYDGALLNGQSLYNSSTLLVQGFLYCVAVNAVGSIDGQAYEIDAYFGIGSSEKGDDGQILLCADVVKQFLLFPIGNNDTIAQTANATRSYCCLTDACNSPDTPIINMPPPPQTSTPPPALHNGTTVLPPRGNASSLEPLAAPPPAQSSTTIACFNSALLNGDSLYNTSTTPVTHLSFGYSFCVAMEAVGYVTGVPYRLTLYLGITANQTTTGGGPLTCAEVVRQFQQYVIQGDQTVQTTATSVRTKCCYTDACNSPGIAFANSPPPELPPPMPSFPNHPGHAARTKTHHKPPPPPCRKTTSAAAKKHGRRWGG